MRARRFLRSLPAVRNVLAAVVALAAVATLGFSGLIGSGTAATAAPAATADLKTVPFEVSGELPIYPKALWQNGSSSADVRKVEARLVQLKLLDKQYQDNSFGTSTRTAVKKFQASDFSTAGFSSANIALEEITAIQTDETTHVSVLEVRIRFILCSSCPSVSDIAASGAHHFVR